MSFRRRVWHLGTAMLVLLLLVSTRIVYWQLVRGQDLQPLALDPVAAAMEASHLRGAEPGSDSLLPGDRTLQGLPQPVVQRTTRLLASITRGSIFDREGIELAQDQVNADGVRERTYSDPSLAPVIGYVSGLRTGVTGLEYSYNNTLLGLDRLDAQLGRLINQPIVGSDLVLTIDQQIQDEAERQLGDRAGAVVVLDGHSGAVLAMASTPHVDPNQMLDQDYVSGLLAACQSDPNCKTPFINRATQALYVPGSTFKTVSLIAALDTGQVTTDTIFDFGQPVQGPNGPYYVYRVGGGEIPDPNHKESKLSLAMSYADSANAAFAKIGDEMPPDDFIDYASRLGFSANDPFSLAIEYSPSRLANNVNDIRTNPLLRAATAIGQGELLATPLNMAMVVLPVLNKGRMPMPYFVAAVRTPSGSVIKGPLIGSSSRQVMKASTASTVHDIMVMAVESGSGRNASVSGYTVGGKTGTAQVGGDLLPHAWFIGFVEKDQKAVVIAVMVENGGEGYKVAAPIFAQVGKVAMQRLSQGEPEALPTLPPPPTPAPQALNEVEEGAIPTEIAPTPTPTAAPTQAGVPLQVLPPTPTLAPTPAGILAPDIAFDPNKPSLDAGLATCPGQFTPVEGTGKWTWPSQYQAISGTNFQPGHPGIDLSAPAGTPVYAADRGRVIFAGWTDVGYGNAVLIDHGNGYRTLYGHLSQVSTYCGAKVAQGQVIGLSGSTGNSSGPHLHFEVRVPGGYIDPLRVLPVP